MVWYIVLSQNTLCILGLNDHAQCMLLWKLIRLIWPSSFIFPQVVVDLILRKPFHYHTHSNRLNYHKTTISVYEVSKSKAQHRNMRFSHVIQWLLFLTTSLSLTDAFSSLVGTKIPPCELHFGFPPQKVLLPAYAANKNMILLGLPGAFTPTSSDVQVPGYLHNQDLLKE